MRILFGFVALCLAVSLASFFTGCGDDGTSSKGNGPEPATLLVSCDEVLLAVDLEGNSFVFDSTGAEVEVLGTRIFLGPGNPTELDHNGEVIGTVLKPPEIPWSTTFTVLPDAGFAFIQNDNDSIFFMSSTGEYLHGMPTPHQSPSGLQSTRATTVGNSLVMVETRSDYIFAIDLDTYEVDTLTAVVPGGDDLRDVFYSDGVYYTCRSYGVYGYSEGEGVSEICTIEGANHCAICVVGDFAYVCGYGREDLYRVDLSTGEFDVLMTGLDDPDDIEFIPVILEPPAGR